jgi:hypothetical protein
VRLEAELADAAARASKAEAEATQLDRAVRSLTVERNQLRSLAVLAHADGVQRPLLARRFVHKHAACVGRGGRPPEAGEEAAAAAVAGAARVVPALPAAAARVEAALAALAAAARSDRAGADSWAAAVQRCVRQVRGGLRRHPDCASLLDVAARAEALVGAAAQRQAAREAQLVDALTALLDERGDPRPLPSPFGSSSSRSRSGGGPAAKPAADAAEPAAPAAGAAAAAAAELRAWRRDHHLHRSLDDPLALRELPRRHGLGDRYGAADPGPAADAAFLRRSADAALPARALPTALLDTAAARARRNMP